MKFLSFFLIFIPLSITSHLLHWNPVWVFTSSALAIVPLAAYMGLATEEISFYAGPKIGGFLNATFGNATELIIAIFALKAGLFDVVKASIAGSVLGNILLVLGASMLLGGAKYKTQSLNRRTVEISVGMLVFAIICLGVPAVFLRDVTPHLLDTWRYETLSLILAAIMLIIYALGLFFSFSRIGNAKDQKGQAEGLPQWSLRKANLILLLTTIVIAVESELLVGAIEPATKAWGISEFFVGIILIPIVGNAAEHSTAMWMAMKNKMEVSMEIAMGSSLQIALFVFPVLIIIGAFIGRTMGIVLSELELISLLVAVFIVNRATVDGKSNWLEGAQLIAVYLIIAVCFFWV